VIAPVGCPHCGGRYYEVLHTGIRSQVICLGCNARGPTSQQGDEGALLAWMQRDQAQKD